MKENILITGGSGLLALNWAATMREKFNITLGLHDRKVNLKNTNSILLNLDSKEALKKAFEEFILIVQYIPPGIEPGPLQLQCAPYTKGILWAVIQSPPLEFESFSY